MIVIVRQPVGERGGVDQLRIEIRSAAGVDEGLEPIALLPQFGE